MSATFRLSPHVRRPLVLSRHRRRPRLRLRRSARRCRRPWTPISAVIEPLCASSDPAGSTLDVVEPICSYALPNVPGKRVTIVRVFYGPGGFTRAHRHAGSVTAYITKGEIRSQLAGGPVETFRVGQSFFEPPGADASGLGQCQHDRARRTDRGVRGRRRRAAHDVCEVAATCRVGKAKRAHHL